MPDLIIKEICDPIETRKNVAIVITTFNQFNDTKKLIELLFEQTYIPDIIVVDNDSNDNTFEYFREMFPNIILIKSGGNYGGAGGFYLGENYAYDKGYEWIILSDNDAYPVSKNLIEVLIQKANENKLVVNTPRNIAEKEVNSTHNFVSFFHYTTLHRELIKKIGFVNYNLFIYGDEVEYYNRIRQNHSTNEIPDIHFFHPFKNFVGPKMMYFMVRNQNHNSLKYLGFINLIKENILLMIFNTIAKYLWNLNTYFTHYLLGLKDLFKNNFSDNQNIISAAVNDGLITQKDSINNFFDKYRNDNKTLLSFKKVFNGKVLDKELNLNTVFVPTIKDYINKNTLITNQFTSPYRNFLGLIFIKKNIFVKDINFDKNEIEFFELENKLIKKIITIFMIIIHLPFVILYCIAIKLKYGNGKNLTK